MKGLNEFPFSPFFQVLSESGIRVTLADYGRLSKVLRCEGDWDITKLGAVLEALLTKNPEERKRFRKCFDSFFTSQLPDNSQKDQGIIDLVTKRDSQGSGLRPKDYVRYLDYIVLVIFAFAALAFLPELKKFGSGLASIVRITPGPAIPGASPQPTLTGQLVESPNQPGRKEADPSALWPFLKKLAIGLGIVAVGYGLVRMLNLSRKYSVGRTAPVIRRSRFSADDGPRVFSLSAIGGEPIRLLSENAFDQMASAIRYAVNEQPTAKLDINRSVTASAHRGGLLALVYQRSKTVRNINIIVDAYSEPLLWNRVPQELAAGLSRQGVIVASGKFFGKPDRFRMEDGASIWVEDLEEMRDSSMLFIFSDGKHLDYRRDRYVLELFRKFRALAWFDLREPQFWDDSASLINRFRLPFFQANEKGIIEAMDYFLDENGEKQKEREYGNRVWRSAPAFVSGDLDSDLEQLLGDALPWAQVCSVLQPLPLKFANALREKFQPQLPQERVERLFRLPGTWFDAAGLHFSRNTLASLRLGFSVRWDDTEQLEILRFIVSAIESAEPPEKESLKHLAWEWAVQRVRLDLEPDEALRQIAQLARTPLGPHIREEMARVLNSYDYSISKQTTRRPLRILPKTATGKRIMAQLSGSGELDSEFWTRFREMVYRTESFLLMRLAIGFFRGIAEYVATIYEFLIYFPYPAGCRNVSGYYDQPGFRNLQSWF
jgi:hypothetical protein